MKSCKKLFRAKPVSRNKSFHNADEPLTKHIYVPVSVNNPKNKQQEQMCVKKMNNKNNCKIIVKQLENKLGMQDAQQPFIERQLVDPDDFFSDPEEVNVHHEQKINSEWIVVEKNKINDLTTCIYENGQHSLAIVKGTALITDYDKESFANSLMGPLLRPSEVLTISHHSANKLIKQKEDFCLEKHFGLNNCGRVIIHLDHIEVFEGLVEIAAKLEHLGKVYKAKEVTEDFKLESSIEEILVNFFKKILRKGNIHICHSFNI